MKKFFSNPVLQHFAIQLGTGAILALVTYLAGADYSALGVWGPIVQGAAAIGLSAVHKATGATA